MIAIAPPNIKELHNYLTWLDSIGVSYKILQPNEIINECYDMLLLCGGPDIGKKGKEERDKQDINWFKQAYGKISILGICRGLQLANIVLGGTLYENINEDKIKHSTNRVEISGDESNKTKSSFHHIIYNKEKILVNSRHHQGIKKIANGLNVLALSEKDDLIEMIEGENSLFVQWHPEKKEIRGTLAEQIVSNWILKKLKYVYSK